MSTIWGLDAATDLAFRNAYIASRDPRLQAIWQKRLGSNVDAWELLSEALTLAKGGEVLVNLAVDGYGSDPLPWMLDMENQGYHSMWNALQPAGNVSAYSMPPGQAPPGAVLVSSNIADFPPFAVPAPVPPPAPSVVGNFMSFQLLGADGKMHDVYGCSAQFHFAEGFPVVVNGATFLYHMMGNPEMDPLNRTGVWLKQ